MYTVQKIKKKKFHKVINKMYNNTYRNKYIYTYEKCFVKKIFTPGLEVASDVGFEIENKFNNFINNNNLIKVLIIIIIM